MTAWVMRLLASNGLITVGSADVLDKENAVYLSSYDPDAHAGRGHATWTDDPRRALKFESPKDLLECWKRESTVCPIRADGKPNRPLTAFSITPEKLEQ